MRPRAMRDTGKLVPLERNANSSSESDYDTDEEIELEQQPAARLMEIISSIANNQEEKSLPKELKNRKQSGKKSKEVSEEFVYVVARLIEHIEKTSPTNEK